MEFVLKEPKPVGGVLEILWGPFACGIAILMPQDLDWMVIFLPQDLEETLLEKELAYRGRDEGEIKSTQFGVVHDEAGYDLRVVNQTLR